jgi:hypothetical protein
MADCLIYRSLHELPVANFYEILQTGNYKYLYKCNFWEVSTKPEPSNEFAILFEKMKLELPVFKPELYQTEAEILYLQCKELEAECDKILHANDGKIAEIGKAELAQIRNKKRAAEAKLKKQLSVKTGAQQTIKERAINVEMAFEGKCRFIDVYTIDTITFLLIEQQAIELVERKRRAYEKQR